LNDDELKSNGNEKYDDEENLSLKYFESKRKKNNQALFFREIDDHTHLDLLGNMTVAYVAPTRKFCFWKQN